MANHGTNINGVAVILVVEGGRNRKVADIRLSRRDASIYVFPYCTGRSYYFGSSFMPEKQTEASFDFTVQKTSFDKPHLSIHESGAVQVTVNRKSRAGPVQITPLTEAPTGHLATVRVDRILGLREHNNPLRQDGTEIDWPVRVPTDCASCKLILRLRRDGETIPPGTAYVPLRSPCLVKPLFLCFEVKEDVPIGTVGNSGVTVIAGWNPVPITPASLPPVDFVYLRAE
jgi:hypothetical protein